MALSPEDKKDVSKSMGKALANKVSKVTRDRKVYPQGGFGKDKTESYSNIRKSVTNFHQDPEYRGHIVAKHMRDNYNKNYGAVGKSIARNEDKFFKKSK